MNPEETTPEIIETPVEATPEVQPEVIAEPEVEPIAEEGAQHEVAYPHGSGAPREFEAVGTEISGADVIPEEVPVPEAEIVESAPEEAVA